MHKLLSFEINPPESFTLQRESGSPCDWDACLLCQAVDISSILLCDSLVRVSASLVGRLNPYISLCHLETLLRNVEYPLLAVMSELSTVRCDHVIGL